jgi:hypothetical protein
LIGLFVYVFVIAKDKKSLAKFSNVWTDSFSKNILLLSIPKSIKKE